MAKQYITMVNPIKKLYLLYKFFRLPTGSRERQEILYLLLHESERESFMNCYRTYIKSDVPKNHSKIIEVMYDWDKLSKLPEDTLGYQFYHYHNTSSGVDLINIGVETLLGKGGSKKVDDFRGYLTVMHDLTHVLNGYPLNRTGEIMTVWFQAVQDNRRSFAWITYVSSFIWIKNFKFWPKYMYYYFRWLFESRRNAKQCKQFILVDWFSMIDKPVSEVKQLIGLNDAEKYHTDKLKMIRTINKKYALDKVL